MLIKHSTHPVVDTLFFGKRKLVFMLSLTFSGFFTNAQNLNWAVSMSGSQSEVGNAITLDASGNIYTTGTFTGTVDFDPGPGLFNLTATNPDIFVSKLDNSGNLIWAKNMEGGTPDSRSIALDAAGNVYITGNFNGTVDFDPGPGVYNIASSGGADIFVCKLDPSGAFVWAVSMTGPSTSNELSKSIAIDGPNLYITGGFTGTIDFDPGPGTFPLVASDQVFFDAFICKLDLSGTFIWAKQLGGSGAGDIGHGIAIDPSSGDVYTTGYFVSVADFDPGPTVFNLTSAGSNDIFLWKLDAAGNFIWAKGMGGTGPEIAHSVAIHPGSGSVYISGQFTGTADFDPGAGVQNITSAGGSDIFICKFDGPGNFLWAKSMGGTAADISHSVDVDINNNVYTTGIFAGTADFDPGIGIYNQTSAGSSDIFISKLDASGNFVWAGRMGGTLIDASNSLSADANCNVYTTGSFSSTSDFDPGTGVYNLIVSGEVDIFVNKLSPLPLLASVSSQTDVLCNGSCTGTATITATGGISPYIYNWSPVGGSGATAADLCPGTYTVTVTDGGCVTTTKTVTVTITEPEDITATITNSDATCGNNNGTATVTASGGTSTLTYLWSPSGQTTATATNLAKGSHSVTITDANGCNKNLTVDVGGKDAPNAVISSQTNVLCNGESTGSATVSVSEGAPPYSYNWTPSGGTNNSATALSAGTYTVTVTDNNGCEVTKSVTITQPAPISATITGSSNTCGEFSGTATVSASGGTGALSYSWNPSGSSAATAANLASGTHSVTITDANGCKKIFSAVVETNKKPLAKIMNLGDTLFICPYNQATINISLAGTGNFIVTYMVPNSPTPKSFTTPGFSFILTVNDEGWYKLVKIEDNLCDSILTDSIYVKHRAIPSGSFTLSKDKICLGDSALFSLALTGVPPFVVTSTGLGITGPMFPWSKWLKPTSSTTYTITKIADRFCENVVLLDTSVTVNSPPVIESVVETCNLQNTQYTVNVTLNGGAGGYSENGTPFSGNSYTSASIPSGSPYNFRFDDNNSCGPVQVTGTKDCNCITNAGTLESIAPLCEGMNVQVTHKGDSLNDGNDILEYVLHTGGVPPAITILARNNTGFFTEPAGAYPKTFYIAALMGNKQSGSGEVDPSDACYSFTDNIPVIWHKNPTLAVNYADTVCAGKNAVLTLEISGSQSQFDVTINGGSQTLSNISDGYILNLTVNQDTTLNFTAIGYGSDPTCLQNINAPVKISTWSSPIAQNLQFTCNSTGDQYQVSFSIIEGDADSYTVNAIPSGANFTSEWIPANGLYSFILNDRNNCNPLTISGTYNCNCITKAGTAQNSSVEVCENLNAVYLHNNDYVLDGNDTLEYLLHDGSTAVIGNILARNNSGSFSFGAPLAYNTMYFITPVAGNKIGSQADPNDPCFSQGVTIPVIFHELPNLDVTALPNDSICMGDAADLVFNFTGIGPFDIVGTISGNAMNSGDMINLGNLNTTTSYTFTKITGQYCSRDINTSITITLPLPFVITPTITGISCIGLSDGAITTTVAGGFGGHTYEWKNSTGTTISTTSTASNLMKGDYSLLVTDYLGCKTLENYSLPEPPLYGITFLQIFNETCFQSNDGELRVGAPDGKFYKFANSATGQVIDSIPMDSFLVSLHYIPGTNQLVIEVESKNGCKADTTIDMTGLYPITLTKSPDQLVCPGSATTLQIVATGGNGDFLYFWNAVNEGPSKTVSPDSTTTYQVYAEDSKGCPSVTETITITVPEVLFQSITPDQHLCFGDSLNLITYPTGGTGIYTYLWKDDKNNTVSTKPSYHSTAQVTGRYTITTTDSCGTSVSNNVSVQVVQPVQMDFKAQPDTAGCVPLVVTFQNLSIGEFQVSEWRINGQFENPSPISFNRVFTNPGTYDVSLTLTNRIAGCSYFLEKKAYISAYQNAVADFQYQPLEVTVVDPNIHLKNLCSAASTYRWTLDGLEISTERQPQISFVKDISKVYELCLEAINPLGCNDLHCKKIIVKEELTMYVPNTFTPNGDGMNDRFSAICAGMSADQYLLRVFDRWGELLFETNSMDETWDGTFNGEPVQSGVYTWTLKVGVNGTTEVLEKQGRVTLLR